MNDLKTEINGLKDEVELSLKAFDMSLKCLQLEHVNILETSVKVTIHVLYDEGFSDRFEIKMKVLKNVYHLLKGEQQNFWNI